MNFKLVNIGQLFKQWYSYITKGFRNGWPVGWNLYFSILFFQKVADNALDRFLSQGGFNVECESLVVYEKSVYTLENLKINIRNAKLFFFAISKSDTFFITETLKKNIFFMCKYFPSQNTRQK